MTIGDVQAVIALILATAVTLWAAIVAISFLFAEKAKRTAAILESTPGRAIGLGAVIGVIAIVLGLNLLNKGPAGVIGWVLLTGVLFLASIGAAGLARIVGKRMYPSDAAPRNEINAVGRGTAALVAAGLLPVLGWFLLFPLQLFASLGASVIALTVRVPKAEPQAQTQPYQL